MTAPLAEMELAPEKPEAKKIPEFCPNCGTKVFPGRKLCVKCNRDVTRMDKLLAIQAEAAKGPSKEEKIASMVSRVVKAGLILFVIGFVIFGAWGLKLMFTPAKPWDDFPTTRAGAVKEWLTAIAEGTPKSYDRAFMLVSQRVRMASNANEETFHKVADKTIHDEFQKKYGAGWISKVEFVKSEYPLEDAEEMVEFRIGEDTYHVGTQVQQAMDQMVMNLAARQRLKYGEDGTYHFGVTECLEFPAHPPEIDRSGPPPNYGGTGAPVY